MEARKQWHYTFKAQKGVGGTCQTESQYLVKISFKNDSDN